MRKRKSKKESTKKKDFSQEHINSLKKARESRLNPRSRTVCFDGMLFETIKDFAQAYGYDASTVCAWLNKRYEPANKAFTTVRYGTELDLKNKNNVRYDAKTMGRLKEPNFDWTAYFNAEVREEEQELDRYYELDECSISSVSTETVICLGSKDEDKKDIDEVLFDYIEDDYYMDDYDIM